MLIGYPLILFVYLKDLEFKGYGIFRKSGIRDIKHYFGILKIWGYGVFQGHRLDTGLYYIPVYKITNVAEYVTWPWKVI